MNPLVIMDAAGNILAVTACNEKSRAKSLEQNELWILTPDTGRVLPWRGGGVTHGTFHAHSGEGSSWYSVEVHAGAEWPQGEQMGLSQELAPAPSGGPPPGGEPPSGPSPAELPPAAEPGASALPILSSLADLVAERRQSMPAGSYTTHLFENGGPKIRKKTGEEAVELILATAPQEIISEAADLVYHMIVLLEHEGLRIEDVVQELHQRHHR